MTYIYKPKGICPSEFSFEIEQDMIKDLKATKGCDGNLKGISTLLIGRKVQDVIPMIKGITCGPRSTSCPDQIAKALEEFLKENN